MVRVYDDWERLVEAVCRREQLRQLSLEDSRTPSTRSFDSDFSFSSSSESFRTSPSSLNPDLLKTKLLEERKRSGTGKRRWKKGLSIFSGLSFSSKKDYGREQRELQWAEDRRTLHGLESMKTGGDLGKLSYEETSRRAEEAKKRAEIARFVKWPNTKEMDRFENFHQMVLNRRASRTAHSQGSH